MRVVAIVLVVLMALTLIVPLFANAGALEDFQSLQKQLDEIAKDLSAIKNTKQKALAARAANEKEIKIIKLQVETLVVLINEANEDLTKKQQEVDAMRVRIADTRALFEQRLRAMYMMRNESYASTLLTVGSFYEYLTAKDALQRISIADTNLLKRLDAEKLELEHLEQEFKQKLQSLEQERQSLDKKIAQLAEKIKQYNSQISTLDAQQEASQVAYDKIWPTYAAAKADVEKEFNSGTVKPAVGSAWGWPVPNFTYISSGYGWRTIFGKKDLHIGLDIAGGGKSIYGAPIVASESGWVKTARYGSTGYGNYVILDHGANNFTLYGHCSSLAVSVGQFVNKGQIIAYVGSTGNSTGPHCHFEIRLNGVAVDPLPHVI